MPVATIKPVQIRIEDKFLELGYIRQDFGNLHTKCEVCKANPLTDLSAFSLSYLSFAHTLCTVWKRIRPILEPDVQFRQHARLLRERKLLIERRQTKFTQHYDDVVKNFRTDNLNLIYVPRAVDIFEMPEIDQLLSRTDNSEFDPGEEACVAVFDRLDVLIQEWTDQRKKELAAIVRPAGSSRNTNFEQVLRLATSVFRCATRCCVATEKPSILIGWDEVAAHACEVCTIPRPRTQPTKTIVEYSERASLAVHSLASLFGLDSRTAVAADLDCLNVVLTCSHCPATQKAGVDCRLVMSWRGAVSSIYVSVNSSNAIQIYHIMSMGATEPHTTPQWKALSEAASDDILTAYVLSHVISNFDQLICQ
jgi:hypothetical protein